jgi:hypothetical protein
MRPHGPKGEPAASAGAVQAEPVDQYPGAIPALITRAYALAEDHALTMPALAQELSYRLPQLRLLLGQEVLTAGAVASCLEGVCNVKVPVPPPAGVAG